MSVFNIYKPTDVMHFAGLKSVKESEEHPEKYDEIHGGQNHFYQSLREFECRNFISSSARLFMVTQNIFRR